MYWNGTLLERYLRGIAVAKREGVLAIVNAVSGALGAAPAVRGRWRQGQAGGMAGSEPPPRVVGLGPLDGVATAVEELAAVPLVVAESFFEAFRAPPPPVWVAGPGAGAAAPAPTDPGPAILAQANAFLDRVPGGGALLADLVANVVLQTGYDAATVRSVLLRNFQSDGTLVWRGGPAVVGTAGVIARMRNALQNLGYTDLRENYPLTAIPSRNDRAALLAFDGSDAAVLCYPVNPGQVVDPMLREAAFFQAGAVAPGQTTRFVWVSDGAADFFYDFRGRVAIGLLPARLAPGPVVP